MRGCFVKTGGTGRAALSFFGRAPFVCVAMNIALKIPDRPNIIIDNLIEKKCELDDVKTYTEKSSSVIAR